MLLMWNFWAGPAGAWAIREVKLVPGVPTIPAPLERLQGTEQRGDNALSLSGTIQDPSPLTPQPHVGPRLSNPGLEDKWVP